MKRSKPTTSAFGRLVKVGGLVGRVGTSMLGTQAAGVLRSGPAQQLRKAESLVRNATRIAATLGEMKGGAMKLGQMLSLHEELMPPEVAAILGALQGQTPAVPFEIMQYEVQGELENYNELFASLEPEAFAAASIGQVHRGVLRDGRQVAVKIQYPEIERMVKADLHNMKHLLGSLVGLIADIDFDSIWEEVSERLHEELDYLKEADNLRRAAALHADVPEIIVPAVVAEATTQRVLTMEFVDGISPRDIDQYPAELRDRWGLALYEHTIRGLLQHRFLHADPNLANFAFRDDGRVIVYDFGCAKEVPEPLARGYAHLLTAILEDRKDDIPEALRRLGVFKQGDKLLPREATDPPVAMVQDILRRVPPYTFGEDENLYRKLFELGTAHWNVATDLRFPRDVVFIDRAFGGLLGNLCKLGATGPWRDTLERFVLQQHA